MIILDVEQGSQEWMDARLGIPTASNFEKIVTMKGDLSKQSQKYLYQLVGERLSGKKEDGYQNAYMQRGTEMEGEARSAYEMLTDNDVQVVGLCYQNEEKLFSCSPDGLIGDDGGLEIKCPTVAVHISYLVDGKLPSAYFQQVQGNLFVTGRKWWDFMSYYPSIDPFIFRVERDEKFIKALDESLKTFCGELNLLTEKLKKKAG